MRHLLYAVLLVLSFSLHPAAAQTGLRLNEILASNANTLADEDGDFSDWIELYNGSSASIKLEGYSLSDDASQPDKWIFPNTNILSKGYLVVFASGKNRKGSKLHTNFGLDSKGEFLGLFKPDKTPVSVFDPFPSQKQSISYGYQDASNLRYFTTPTPGGLNRPGNTGFAPEIQFDPPGGIHTNTVTLKLTTVTGKASIRYTLDGKEPTLTSTLYTKALILSSNTLVRARAFQTGLLAGEMASQNYIRVDPAVAQFNSNLPLLVVETFNQQILNDTNRPASALLIDTARGRSSMLATPDFNGRGTIRIRGQSSSGFPKKAFAFEVQDEAGQDRKVSLLGMPEDSDWIFYNPYTDKTLMRNVLAYDLARRMNQWAPRTKFIEAFVHQGNGPVTMADYVGVYVLIEKIKRGTDRVDIDKLSPAQTNLPAISGGYIFKRDKLDPGENHDFLTSRGVNINMVEPDWVEMPNAQRNYLQGYLTQFESTLTDGATRDGVNGYSKFIDVPAFVDYGWMIEFPKNMDMLSFSTYMTKEREGKLRMGPVWDFDIGFGNANYNNAWLVNGWHTARSGATITGFWYPQLHSDPAYEQKSIDRWGELRTNIFNSNRIDAWIDANAALLQESQVRNFNRWPVLGTYVWPNPCPYPVLGDQVPGGAYGQPAPAQAQVPCPGYYTTFAEEISHLKAWLRARGTWIDQQFPATPSFSHPGGKVSSGFQLTITNNSPGIIFYTLDGTDPRPADGGLADVAKAYSGPITLTANARVMARNWFTNSWGPPTVATYVVKTPELSITEIMYHPNSGIGNRSTEDYEFIEFKNIGSTPLALGGFRLSGGVSFAFPSALTLPAGGRTVVVKNMEAFHERYGAQPVPAGSYAQSLSNQGDRLILEGPLGEPIVEVAYDNDWFRLTDGFGFSLVPQQEEALGIKSDAAQWRISGRVRGSPGAMDPPPLSIQPVRAQEIHAAAIAPDQDYVELFNPGSQPSDVSGWLLSDGLNLAKSFRIPSGTVLAPGASLILNESEFNPDSSGFSFSSLGEEVWLFSANAAGDLTGFLDGFKFGATPNGTSTGRFPLSSTNSEVGILRRPTPGQANVGPRLSPVVLSEIHYHPTDVSVNGQQWNNTEEEFIELHNVSDQPVVLGGAGESAWQISGGIEYAFSSGFALPPGGYVIVTSFDPSRSPSDATNLRTKFQIPLSCALVGPFERNLNNAGETVTLLQPEPTPSGLARIVRDFVTYEETWGANGDGKSLQRRNTREYGNDKTNWQAETPSAGAPFVPSSKITFSTHPAEQTIPPGERVTFAVTASADSALSYQWKKDGILLVGATAPTYTIASADLSQEGDYAVIVRTAAGSVTSREARLTIRGDSDGDGIPDDWELRYDLDPRSSADGEADPDGDGLTNREEYLAGTDPTQATSTLKLSTEGLSAQGFVIRFHAIAGQKYSVLRTSQVGGGWEKLADVPEGAERTVAITDTAPGSSRFYRLVTPSF